tara:strand:+ start:170 stop:493 length:324 start_codon:yes stop_codon:yes gene_type:complete
MVVEASFPVTENGVNTEVVADNTNLVIEAPVRGGGPGMGIAALCCGILGFFFLPFLLGPLAIIFGALGLKNRGRGMAIAGLVLGIIQVLLVVIVLLLVGAAISAGLY